MNESIVLADTPAPGVRRITLNRPDKRNALNLPLREALYDATYRALDDEDCRVLVLRGAGGCFCAGGDVRSMQGLTPQAALSRLKTGHQFVRRLARTDKVLVAALEGPASGAGVSIALLCDLIVADDSLRMSFPFQHLGLVPDWGLMHTLPDRVGWATARRLLLTCATLDASRCQSLGLIDEHTEHGKVQAVALDRAVSFAQGPTTAQGMLKHGLGLARSGLDAVLEYEAVAQASCLTGTEFEEGLRAFVDKRPANFHDTGQP